jgi:hypothetical protein
MRGASALPCAGRGHTRVGSLPACLPACHHKRRRCCSCQSRRAACVTPNPPRPRPPCFAAARRAGLPPTPAARWPAGRRGARCRPAGSPRSPASSCPLPSRCQTRRCCGAGGSAVGRSKSAAPPQGARRGSRAPGSTTFHTHERQAGSGGQLTPHCLQAHLKFSHAMISVAATASSKVRAGSKLPVCTYAAAALTCRAWRGQ